MHDPAAARNDNGIYNGDTIVWRRAAPTRPAKAPLCYHRLGVKNGGVVPSPQLWFARSRAFSGVMVCSELCLLRSHGVLEVVPFQELWFARSCAFSGVMVCWQSCLLRSYGLLGVVPSQELWFGRSCAFSRVMMCSEL